MRIIFLSLILLLTACGPTTKESLAVANYSNLSNSSNYLSKPAGIPEPTAEPTLMVISVLVSHYSCSEQEGTADCITFDGSQAGPGTIASNDWPIGTPVIIEGKHYTVTDRGGGLRPGQVDMWVPDRATAFKLGVKRVSATIERER